MKYPIGIQSFDEIRKGGYVYVDKTEYLFKLVDTGKYYFLSRPRRFGKSLMISTLEAYFLGKKELFQGLAMERLEKEWNSYPVLHLDLNARLFDTPEALKLELSKHLEQWEKIYGDEYSDRALEERLYHIVRKAYEYTGRNVVILIDEYDKPMLQAIGNDALQEQYRNTLKAFYSVLKSQDRYIKFAMLTGVTKFGKVSVFSDLNNLEDLSMLKQWVGICGISEQELHEYFDEPIHELAKACSLTYEQACDKLKEQYDGYHFCENTMGIYNPFSVLNTFKNKVFKDYWFETGTPTFLVKLMQSADYDLNKLAHEMQTSDMLNCIDSTSKDPVPVIYQSGYLTIKDYDERFKYYTLGFPNKEVEQGFINYLLPFYSPKESKDSEFFINRFICDIEKGDVEGFMQRLVAFFDDGDYQVMGKMELYFQNVMYVIFKVMGFYTEVEKHTAKGRIDVILKTKDYIYVIEIKRDGSARKALQQIEEKGYAKPFAMDERKLYKIGINFSSEARTIDDYIIE